MEICISIIIENGVVKNNGDALRNRPKLIEKGILSEKDDEIVFFKNHLFSSPSSAASLVAGASLSGWVHWKDESGNALDENERVIDEISGD